MHCGRQICSSRRRIQKIAGSFWRRWLGSLSSGFRIAWFLCRPFFGTVVLRFFLAFFGTVGAVFVLSVGAIRSGVALGRGPTPFPRFLFGFWRVGSRFVFLRGALSFRAPLLIFCCVLELRRNFSLDETPS